MIRLMTDQVELTHAFGSLSALKANLPDHTHTAEKYVSEFHLILDALTRATNFNLERYRVPVSEIRRVPVVFGPRGTKYSDGKFCDRAFLMMKIDAVLNLFQLAGSERQPIGFAAS